MKLLLIVVMCSMLVSCAAITSWLTSDAGGEPELGPTKGETLADTVEESTSNAGPFAVVGLLGAMLIRRLSRRKAVVA